MLFRQFFDRESSAYTYLLAPAAGSDCLIVDPVRDGVDDYLRAVSELDLTLIAALDTHLHADHISGIGALADRAGCMPRLPATSGIAEAVGFDDGEDVGVPGLSMQVMVTPGHTEDSCCFLLADRILTGDTLLIRGTGRTDFQNGDAGAAWDSLQKLLALADETRVYPGHDYKGWTMSTIGEERRHNPRVKARSREAYIELMGALNLPRPKRIETALPANRRLGRDSAPY
jgi:glyoxylase-like metal-dependent hydrolase (beta-lactamase superfamily II)